MKSDKEQVILNLRQAYRLAGVGERREPIPEPPPLSEARICELHGAITQGLDHDRYLPGAYRFGPVEVGDADHGGKYKPPKVPEDIKMLMARFVEWANSPELTKGTPPVVRAFLVHYHLALIHPFRDGNGRLARVLEAELLEQARFRYVSLMMSNFYYERIDDYYRAFSAAEQNSFNLTPFLVFCLDGLVQSLTSIHFRVTEQIRRLALRKHCDDLKRARKLSWRRHGLLLLLLDDDRPFTAADLKSEPRFAALYGGVSDLAVWRDLRRLQEMSLLVPADAGRLRVNLRVLG